MMCGRLTRPQVARVDGNVYVRRGAAAQLPLLVWSPVADTTCQVELESLDALRKLHPAFEANGRFLSGVVGAFFKSPELMNYEPIGEVVGTLSIDTLPAAIRKLLGWPETGGRVPGAYPSIR
jgi:hypothetical protein